MNKYKEDPMLQRIIGGISVGIANVIPGVSGGTMMVLMGIFDGVMDAISGILKKNNPRRKEQIIFMIQVGIGVIVGLVGFAKILEYLFDVFPTQTMYWFIGLVGASIPVFIKKEMKGLSLKPLLLVAGMFIIFILEFLNPETTIDVSPAFPDITFIHCMTMIFVGFVGGFSMFLPGVSGSMVLLILGYYYLFKSYLANVTSFDLNILIPLGFMAIGILIGIVVSAKILNYALEHQKAETLSFLLGLIIASTIVLFVNTLSVAYNFSLIMGCILATLIGIAIVTIMDIFVK